jgi:hypothetical protein
MSNDFYFPLQFNTGTSVLARTGQDIYLFSALASFTANGVTTSLVSGQALNLQNPAKITGNISNCTVGSLAYAYFGT